MKISKWIMLWKPCTPNAQTFFFNSIFQYKTISPRYENFFYCENKTTELKL